MSNIEYISIIKITPHPNNPRKDLGDLKELTESIKAKGVLQNLTVVQSADYSDKYTVVIGHRRLAAAKAAGLESVPCIISNMSEKEQIETMLIENMQRNALTVYEQAGGFQMMIDFGDSITNLSQRTGFSEQTIKHRLKIMEFDKEAVIKAEEQQIKIADYIELEQIKDPKIRNNVLRSYGTGNFKWNLNDAIKNQKTEEGINKIVAKLEKFAVETKENVGYGEGNGYKYITGFWPNDKEKIEKPEEEGEYFYYVGPYSVSLYKKQEIDKKAEEEKAIKEAAIKEKTREAENLNMQTIKCIEDYLRVCTLPKNHIDIYKYIMNAMCNWSGLDVEKACKFLKIKIDKETQRDDARAILVEAVEEQGLKLLFIGAYLIEKEKIKNGYVTANSWTPIVTYNRNPPLDRIYALITLLGYQMSDEEKQLKAGTHEIFNKEIEEIRK